MSVSVTYIVTQSMDRRAYSFKSSATYPAWGHFKEKQASLASKKIMVDDEGGDFQASFPDIFAQYQNPPTHRGYRYGKQGLEFLENHSFQLVAVPTELRVWCTTPGCGVSVEDHLQATDLLLASLYHFHVYFTTRHILEELRVTLPGEKSRSWYLNTFDARAHKRLCSEFGVSPETDWRQKLDHGCQGLGSWSTYVEPWGAYRHGHYSDGTFFHPKDAIRHSQDISGAWMMFIIDKSEGFTQAGVERLNNSIGTYVWAILGLQAQTRSNILMAETGFDAQKQFQANVEDAIASPVVIPSSIARYQKTLQYASTPLDFVFGIGLYLAPSDMALHLGNVQGYNNKIVIAGSEAAISHNPGINELEQISGTGDKSFEGKIAAPAGTDHKGPLSGKPAADIAEQRIHAADVAKQRGQEKRASGCAAATSHEDNKTALIAAGVGVGLVALWLGSHLPFPCGHEKKCPHADDQGPHIVSWPSGGLP